MFESLGRGLKMISASIRLGWQDNRLLLPSILTVLTNFIFGILLAYQGMVFYQNGSVTAKQVAGSQQGHALIKQFQSGNFNQLTELNGAFDQSGWGTQAVETGGEAAGASMIIMALWWLTNRFLEGVTTALVYSHLTEGPGSGKFSIACRAVFSSLPWIVCFGAATFLANNFCKFLKGKGATSGLSTGFSFTWGFLANIVQIFWTLAGHLILPAIVIEGATFLGALKRADKIASGNLLTIGFSEICVLEMSRFASFAVYAIGLAGFAYASSAGLLHTYTFMLATVLWACLVVFTTALSVYIRAAFYTCLYVWAIEAEAVGSLERHHVRPPAPLAAALA
jgi:hypothetical protein